MSDGNYLRGRQLGRDSRVVGRRKVTGGLADEHFHEEVGICNVTVGGSADGKCQKGGRQMESVRGGRQMYRDRREFGR